MPLPQLRAVVLAGGEGRRLYPLTMNRPKPVLPVRGRPMLCYTLDLLRKSWVEDVCLAVSEYAEQFERFDARVVVESERLGTGGAVRALLGEGHTLVLNGDTVLDLDLEGFYRSHLESQAEVSVAVVQVENCCRYGAVTFDSGNRVVRFAEKSAEGSGWVNAGVYLLSPRVRLPERRVFSLENDFFPTLAADLFRAWPSGGSFQDLGTHQAYLNANLAEHRVDSGSVSDGGVIEPPVFIGPGCRIGEGAFLSRCLLERDVRIGRNCRVTECILGPGVTVRDGTELYRQVVVKGEPPHDLGMSH